MNAINYQLLNKSESCDWIDSTNHTIILNHGDNDHDDCCHWPMFDFDAPPSKRVSLDATETWMTVDSTEDLDSFMFTTENDDDPILYQLQHQHPPFELLFMEASQTQEFQERKAQLEKCMRASRMSRQCLKKLTQTIQQRTKLLQVLNDIEKSTKIG